MQDVHCYKQVLSFMLHSTLCRFHPMPQLLKTQAFFACTLHAGQLHWSTANYGKAWRIVLCLQAWLCGA